MNVLVTGANGQLGNEMRIITAARAANGCQDRYFFTDVAQASEEQIRALRHLAGDAVDTSTGILDVTDLTALRKALKDNDINIVVNCAAYTNVDAAENNRELAEKLNADAPAKLAKAVGENDGLLIHISTDYVFGKEEYNTPCTEDRTGTPTGVYGLTKLHGEQKILKSGCDYVIIRTSWLYSEFGKNFCRSILAATSKKSQINVVFDQAGTPTYALDLANAIFRVISDYGRYAECRLPADVRSYDDKYPGSGIYNFSNEGVCSWFDFAKMIQEYSGQTYCQVRPCHSSEYSSVVKRPSYSVLDKTRIKNIFGVDVPYWTDSLRKCIKGIMEIARI